jgi:cbb3-type cytochrome oxidase maturation protein
MSVMYLLVPLALFVVALAVAAYVWAARKGQFDDLKTPAMRMVHDDEPGVESRESSETALPPHDSRLTPHD